MAFPRVFFCCLRGLELGKEKRTECVGRPWMCCRERPQMAFEPSGAPDFCGSKVVLFDEAFKQNGRWIWNTTTLRKSSFFGICFRDICVDNSKSWLLFQNRCRKLCGNPKHPSGISSGEVGCVWAKNQKFFLWKRDTFLLFNLEMTSSRRLDPPKNDGDGFAETFETFDEIFPTYHRVRLNVIVWVELCCSHTGG